MFINKFYKLNYIYFFSYLTLALGAYEITLLSVLYAVYLALGINNRITHWIAYKNVIKNEIHVQ